MNLILVMSKSLVFIGHRWVLMKMFQEIIHVFICRRERESSASASEIVEVLHNLRYRFVI